MSCWQSRYCLKCIRWSVDPDTKRPPRYPLVATLQKSFVPRPMRKALSSANFRKRLKRSPSSRSLDQPRVSPFKRTMRRESGRRSEVESKEPSVKLVDSQVPLQEDPQIHGNSADCGTEKELSSSSAPSDQPRASPYTRPKRRESGRRSEVESKEPPVKLADERLSLSGHSPTDGDSLEGGTEKEVSSSTIEDPIAHIYAMSNGEPPGEASSRPKRQAALNRPDYHALHHHIATPTAKWLDLINDPEKYGKTIKEGELDSRPQVTALDCDFRWLPSFTWPPCIPRLDRVTRSSLLPIHPTPSRSGLLKAFFPHDPPSWFRPASACRLSSSPPANPVLWTKPRTAHHWPRGRGL